MTLAVGSGVLTLAAAVKNKEVKMDMNVGPTANLNITLGSGNRPISEQPIVFIMVGMTGHGKSTSANSLSGTDHFKASDRAKSETSKVSSLLFRAQGQEFRVLDMPGFMDTNMSKDEIQKQLAICGHEAQGFVSAIVIVLKDGRATGEVQQVISYVKQQFGEEALQKFGILLFTDSTREPHDFKVDAQELPKDNEWRKLVLSVPIHRIVSLQNTYPFYGYPTFVRQKKNVLGTITSCYQENATSAQNFVDCEAFRVKNLKDEETRRQIEFDSLRKQLKKAEEEKKKLEEEKKKAEKESNYLQSMISKMQSEKCTIM
eukprot:TRINITY_DN69754_c0_g1_i1.p1 TRINITY_DN69754_c0_g1~~TRINITY_DN69754_c0_g1_i1.p1  ORF type:complete len:356 (+),score=81.18 TRINITY_DN69754_c0_g1_i1:123-1070(+)